ncbi:NADPH dehydrogenase NamA [Lederbergia wuyishanensis]|uniref:NADPH dehydrogenase n=1 Tax=Lederbergia wuyishanensis TaxID=1347903 RepID=A0ABU0D153_9BACI|nr:NADPH dehydrogenase NamA [Lederbergia wuyishanensis]MCJ8006756.1 NADPH dehydrogenase NamA [Lederbergia wuyishanensis]MDQ0342138.1 NADPH2 dehydrogenase [Lederbergia wuyishanensis]
MSVKLFTPFKVKNITIKNRIVMSPMCMYSCSNEDGMVGDWHYTHYTSRAVGQVGLIIVEATAVTPQGRISPRDLGIWSDDHIDGLSKLTQMIEEHGAVSGIQIAHAGRKAVLDGEIIAPSAIPFNESMKTPKEMSIDEIKETVRAFGKAAERAKKAGFKIIEIHGAHGYLINEFLSPLTNKRSDEYGGTLEKRYRFMKEIIEEVKLVWDGPLFVRVSANDYSDGGLNPADYVTMAHWMKEQGVDLIDVSSGAVVPANIPTFPGYQVPFANQIRNEANIPTGAVGLITNGTQAEEILQNGRADLVFIARALLRDPYWPRTAARELKYDLEAPEQYRRGWMI